MSKGTITVVGLGPAGAEYLTDQTQRLLDGPVPTWLRTSRHPAADGLDVAGSFDDLYETLDSFDEVYSTIVDQLIQLASNDGNVVYAVPGSPMVAEHTVELLRSHRVVAKGDIELVVHPAMGFADLCWNALGVDPMAEAATIVDALALANQATGRAGSLLITQVHSAEVLDDVISLLDDAGPDTVTILQGLGTANELVVQVPWSSLRSSVEPDHLTSLWVPSLAEPIGASFARLDELIRDWRETSAESREDTLRSLRDGLAQVSSNVTRAIDRVLENVDDAQFDLEDALADLLYLLAMHARVAAEAGFFTIDDLADGAHARHLKK